MGNRAHDISNDILQTNFPFSLENKTYNLISLRPHLILFLLQTHSMTFVKMVLNAGVKYDRQASLCSLVLLLKGLRAWQNIETLTV